MRLVPWLALALLACGSESKAPLQRSLDLDAINARIPSALRDRLVFERREVVIENEGLHDLVMAVPRGWERGSNIIAAFRPTNGLGTRLGALTKIAVGAACLHGQCATDDWLAESGELFSELLQSSVRKDERGDDYRLVIADVTRNEEVDTEIGFAWWSRNGQGFYYCQVALEDESRAAVDAFTEACRQTRAVKR